MLLLSLFWQWEVLLQTLSTWSSLLVEKPWSHWWFRLTWPPSSMFPIMLSHIILSSLIWCSRLCPNLLPKVSFFHARYFSSGLLSTPRCAFLWPTMAEQFFALESLVPASSPSHQSAVFGVPTSSSYCLTNLWFCMWHHHVSHQNKGKQISCRQSAIRKYVVTAKPH